MQLGDAKIKGLGMQLVKKYRKAVEEYKSPLRTNEDKRGELSVPLGTFLSSSESIVRQELVASSTLNKKSSLIKGTEKTVTNERTDSLVHSGEKTSKGGCPSNTQKLSYKRSPPNVISPDKV